MITKLEDALNGNYPQVYAEVVTEDSYKINSLNFVPDVIYDIGANVGVFTRFALQKFPKAKVIAVEPNEDNVDVLLRFTPASSNLVVSPVALGRGQLYRNIDAPNGAHSSYLSVSDQISQKDLDESKNMIKSSTLSYTLDELVDHHIFDKKTLIKIDIEGNENVIWEDFASLKTLAKFDYIAMEIHPHALTGVESEKAKRNLANAITFLKQTHNVDYKHIYLTARKK